MELSRPVLTTYIAGIPELVIDGENGYMVPAGSLDALVDSMSVLLHASDETINSMGEKARKRVIQRHDIDIEAVKLADFINQGIG